MVYERLQQIRYTQAHASGSRDGLPLPLVLMSGAVFVIGPTMLVRFGDAVTIHGFALFKERCFFLMARRIELSRSRVASLVFGTTDYLRTEADHTNPRRRSQHSTRATFGRF